MPNIRSTAFDTSRSGWAVFAVGATNLLAQDTDPTLFSIVDGGFEGSKALRICVPQLLAGTTPLARGDFEVQHVLFDPGRWQHDSRFAIRIAVRDAVDEGAPLGGGIRVLYLSEHGATVPALGEGKPIPLPTAWREIQVPGRTPSTEPAGTGATPLLDGPGIKLRLTRTSNEPGCFLIDKAYQRIGEDDVP